MELNIEFGEHREFYLFSIYYLCDFVPLCLICMFCNTNRNSHDRFLIVDDKEVYHIGASLKDLGKKMFAFSKMQIDPGLITDKL